MEHRFNRASTYDARGLDQAGVTIVEIVIALAVISLIALLCLLTIPHLNCNDMRATQALCKSTARAIAMAGRTYVSQWNGYTHPDPAHYVKELGYLLKSQDGYDELKARETRDFTCPLDRTPALNRHGYPCSYKVAPSFVGRDISNIDSPADTVVVAETGLRHELDTEMRATCVYADGHTELVTKLPSFVRE